MRYQQASAITAEKQRNFYVPVMGEIQACDQASGSDKIYIIMPAFTHRRGWIFNVWNDHIPVGRHIGEMFLSEDLRDRQFQQRKIFIEMYATHPEWI